MTIGVVFLARRGYLIYRIRGQQMVRHNMTSSFGPMDTNPLRVVSIRSAQRRFWPYVSSNRASMCFAENSRATRCVDGTEMPKAACKRRLILKYRRYQRRYSAGQYLAIERAFARACGKNSESGRFGSRRGCLQRLVFPRGVKKRKVNA